MGRGRPQQIVALDELQGPSSHNFQGFPVALLYITLNGLNIHLFVLVMFSFRGVCNRTSPTKPHPSFRISKEAESVTAINAQGYRQVAVLRVWFGVDGSDLEDVSESTKL